MVEPASAYLRRVIEPLVDVADRPAVMIVHETLDRDIESQATGELRTETVHVFSIRVPTQAVRYLVGKHGGNADALRTILRAWCGANKWVAKVDLVVRSA